MTSSVETMELGRFVPVIVIDDESRAPDVARALSAGGIPCAEVTLRTPAALAAIRAMAAIDGFSVGAGTVLHASQVDECARAGASFLVSPGVSTPVLDRAFELGIPAIPGVATATDLMSVFAREHRQVKFFPADRLGGLETLRALAAPFAGVRFMPSGGVSMRNAAEYLAEPAVFAVSGSWLAPRQAIADGDFAEIERACAEAIAVVPS